MDVDNRDSSPDAVPAGEVWVDPVIEAYKKDVDLSLIRHMLRMSVEDRLVSLERCVRDAAELRRAMIAATAAET